MISFILTKTGILYNIKDIPNVEFVNIDKELYIMTIQLTSKGIKIDDEFRTAVEKEIGKIERRFNGSPTCKVTVKKAENNKVKVSVLIYAGKYVFKGESVGLNKISCLNKSVKDIEKHLNKAKTRQLMKRYMPDDVKDLLEEEEPDEHLSDIEDFVTTNKQIKVQPMTIEEAYMQMDILGHTFFAF